MDIISLITKYDNSENKVDENSISSDIENFIKDKGNASSQELAEDMAFKFMEAYHPSKKGWGRFYGPFVEGTSEDGKTSWEIPSIEKVLLNYWNIG